MQAPSQVMTPYRRFSMMRWRRCRRFVYGRGHGVHSPLAYARIFSLLRPFGGYYLDYEEIAGVMKSDEWIWYRMLARLRPVGTIYGSGSDAGLFRALETYGTGVGKQGGPLLMVTDSGEEASLFFGEDQTGSPRGLLYIGIRRDAESEKAFRKFLGNFTQGVVLDFYTGALVFNNNTERYYYRTTL